MEVRRPLALPFQGPQPALPLPLGPALTGAVADLENDLGHREGLGHVVVRAHLQAPHPLLGLPKGRQDQDRGARDPGVRVAPDHAADLPPLQVREHQVQEHHVGPLGPDQAACPQPVVGRERAKPGPGQVVLQHLGHVRLVLHDQNGCRLHRDGLLFGRGSRSRVTSHGSWVTGHGSGVGARARRPHKPQGPTFPWGPGETTARAAPSPRPGGSSRRARRPPGRSPSPRPGPDPPGPARTG